MKSAAVFAAVLLATPAFAAPPKLIVAISVDQFSADLFAEYRGVVTGGLKRLQSGVVFPSGYQSHAATETCPGHTTLLSGIRPGRAGIPANDWFGMRGGKFDEIYCVEDESVPGSSHDNYTVSLKHLSSDYQPLGDRLKALTGSTTRVFAVSGKDRGATLMAGRNADQTWWYDWRVRGFTTYAGNDTSHIDAVIPALKGVNAKIATWVAKPTAPPPLPAACTRRINPVQVGKIVIGAGPEAPPRTDKPDNTAKDFRPTRALDGATLDVAESMVTANRLGQGAGTDVLAISLSGTDYIGHAYGTEGPEMCAQLTALDARLEHLFALLDQRKINYAVVLSADHGGFDAPERHDQHGYPAAERAATATAAPLLSAMLAKQFGWPDKLIENRAIGGDYWFTPAVPLDRRGEAARWLKDALLKDGAREIAAVFTHGELAAIPVPAGNPSLWTLAERARASFVPDRSGDIFVVLRHGLMPIPEGQRGYVATHGSPWDYDRRVPILFWWPTVKGFEQPFAVETVDILPTLAALIGLRMAPDSVDGRCLDLDPGAGNTCP
jgi:predicted AlkP superfamily pyrophosphatase or phosphodiesterase